MKSSAIPAEVPISLEGVCTLSLECWRLGRLAKDMVGNNAGSGLRHAVRCITDTLGKMGIEVVDFAGRIYDPGMVPRVVEVREDHSLPDGHAVVDETIMPTVTWRGQVISAGQIIVRSSAVRPHESGEGAE